MSERAKKRETREQTENDKPNAENGAAETTTLEEQLASAQAEAERFRENWQRSHAEFLNYKRRTESERAEMAAFASAAVITKLLPIIDDFDLAVANVPADQRETPWVEGIALIQRKLLRLLESEGILPIEAQDQPFDPNLHEAVAVDNDAGDPHHVVQELRRGYRLGERVLRPTLVRVGGPASGK